MTPQLSLSNALVIASTVVLGYHCLLDVLAGAVLTSLVLILTGETSARRLLAPIADIM